MHPDEAHAQSADLKVAVSEITAARKSIRIEVPAEQVASEYDQACRKYMRSLKVPGFRQGKVPLHIVTQRFGREIEQEAVEHVIQHALEHAFSDSGLKPLRSPVLKEYAFKKGEPLAFTAEFEVRPKVAVQGSREIRVKIAEPAVTDRMVSDALDSLRERAARFLPVEGRGVNPGDFALIDIKGNAAAGEGDPFSRDNLLFEVGSGGPNPELTEHLRGMMPGERRLFEVAYPDDHPVRNLAGRRIAYDVLVREIKMKELPDLDDEFARDLGKFQTLDDLRGAVQTDLMERERRKTREEARGSVVEQLLAYHPDLAVPESMVEEELDRRIDDLARTMVLQGMDPRRASVDWNEIREKQRDPAVRAVRAMILLDAVAEQEKISVAPEALDHALSDEASRRRQTKEALRAKLAKDGRLERLEQQLLREKVLDFLLVASNT
ncbi:MAG TPA: trigger factor [Thermoplasmata archaeon]|nr:trigger factor [Thermoplasmata archaeon]